MSQLNTILIIVLVFITTLLVNQCATNCTQDKIIAQNERALKDSSYSKIKTINELKSELRLKDSALSVKLKEIDKTEKIISLTKTVIKFKHDTTKLIINKLIYNDSKIYYQSSFSDSLLSIKIDNNISYKFDSLTNKLNVDSINTMLVKHEFNFGIGLVKSIDKDGFLRVRSKPYYLNKEGGFYKEIPNNKLNIKTEDIVIEPIKKKSNWAITMTPVSIGYYATPLGFQFGIGPSIGFSYVIQVK